MLIKNTDFYLLLYLATKIIYGQTSCSCEIPDSSFSRNVNLLYYQCNHNILTTIAFPITNPEGMLDILEDKRVIIYIFGYLQNPEEDNVQFILKALCHNRRDNVILLDWSKYSKGDYATVFSKAEKVGSLLAYSIRKLVNDGLAINKFYIIGHSLGSHIAGIAGKCNTFAIPRITALDPANSLFYPTGCYLTNKDANRIDIIHTDMFVYGSAASMGTAEYYANGGTRPQPNCPLLNLPLSTGDFCSHQTSVVIYAMSKYNPDEFIATQCGSYVLYMEGSCDGNLRSKVGYAAPDVKGKFYFNSK